MMSPAPTREPIIRVENFRAAYDGLAAEPRAAAERRLASVGALEPLVAAVPLHSGHDPAGTAPFSGVTRMVRD